MLAEPEPDVLTSFQHSQHGTNLRSEPWPQAANVLVPVGGKLDGAARNRLLRPQIVRDALLQRLKIWRAGGHLVELQDHAASHVRVKVAHKRVDNWLLEAARHDE